MVSKSISSRIHIQVGSYFILVIQSVILVFFQLNLFIDKFNLISSSGTRVSVLYCFNENHIA